MSAVRHLASTKARVVALHDAGWKPAEIRRLLARDGLAVPSSNTMWSWTHPDKAAAHAARASASDRRWRLGQASFAWPGVRGPEWKLRRMRVLAEAGLSCAAVARVMTIDFPDTPISRHQAERALARGVAPRPYRNPERSAT